MLIYNTKRSSWTQIQSPAGPPPRSAHQVEWIIPRYIFSWKFLSPPPRGKRLGWGGAISVHTLQSSLSGIFKTTFECYLRNIEIFRLLLFFLKSWTNIFIYLFIFNVYLYIYIFRLLLYPKVVDNFIYLEENTQVLQNHNSIIIRKQNLIVFFVKCLLFRIFLAVNFLKL